MDDLTRIESIYGSVAEYNRVQWEETMERREPTEQELLDNQVELDVYHEKMRLLNGEPSEYAKRLREEWLTTAPDKSNYNSINEYIYASHDWVRAYTLDAFTKIAEYYDVPWDREYATFYHRKVGKFAIEVEHVEYCEIKKLSIGNLDYDLFKDIFRDLEFLQLSPALNYYSDTGHSTILSNSRLGTLRIQDLKWLGLENDEALKTELEELGFDEEAFKAQAYERLRK